MHHIHCIIREHYTNPTIDDKVIGSLIILCSQTVEGMEGFDFTDNFRGRTIMIRAGENCIIAVLNDSKAASIMMAEKLSKINAPLSPIQLRELFARITFNNIFLKDRPKYKSTFNVGKYSIIAELPEYAELSENEESDKMYGELMNVYCKDLLNEKTEINESYLTRLKEGNGSFLFDENENFINHN